MSNQESSTASVVVDIQPVQQSFLDSPVDLKKLFRNISKQAGPAVEALVGLLGSKDEKVRLTAATKLLELQIAVSKEINSDHLHRLIAEVRFNNGASKALVEVEDNRPLVDFTTIREVK